ncbi:MAG: gamma-glutamyltransferase, partial [Myxococcales bacterium]|nr:gamma-glutamyltransferase [Myxococcales bacterium]
GFAGDVTRVWPVSGVMTETQATMHALVCKSQAAALASCRPGVRYRNVHLAAARALTEGLVALGARFGHWADRFGAVVDGAPLPGAATQNGPGSTTHISVIDAHGNATAVTFSHGESCGRLIRGAGIAMNNMMGEEDLHPGGFGLAPPGERLRTMMSPTLLLGPEGGITAFGTGGANRIRTALLQTITGLVDHRRSSEAAVAASRLHYEAGVLNAEIFDRADHGDALETLGAKLVRFDHPAFFFGGVHLVRRDRHGVLSGVGDLRRGGVCYLI